MQQLAAVVDPKAKVEFGALADRPLEPTRIANTAESLAKLGWKPKVSLQEGLERTVEWYRKEREHSPEMQKAIQV